jgi:Flp pilus assembly pilin Flp
MELTSKCSGRRDVQRQRRHDDIHDDADAHNLHERRQPVTVKPAGFRSDSIGPHTKVSLSLPIRAFYAFHMDLLQRFLKDERGQDLIEYTLLMAFIALASAAIFVNAGASISGIWGASSNQLSNAAAAAS